MDINFIKDYIGKMNSSDLKNLMNIIERQCQGAELTDNIKAVFDNGYILELKLSDNTSVYASKFIKSEYGVENVRYFYFKLLNCGTIAVEVPASIIDTITEKKPYIMFTDNGGCPLYIEKDDTCETVSGLDGFDKAEQRVMNMVAARIVSGQYNPEAVSKPTVIEFKTTKDSINEEPGDTTTFESWIKKIAGFVNSDENHSIFVDFTTEKKIIDKERNIVVHQKNSSNELYSSMQIKEQDGKIIIIFENDYDVKRIYSAKKSEINDGSIKVDTHTGQITICTDNDNILKLTLSENANPLQTIKVTEILYA